MNNTEQSMCKKGNLNPMFGKRHSQDTKEKISQSQLKRYQKIRKAMSEQNSIFRYASTTDKSRVELLKNLLDDNTLKFENVQQAVNFLAIILSEEQFERIIKEEICKMSSKLNTSSNDENRRMPLNTKK